jgi:hypothetical protein
MSGFNANSGPSPKHVSVRARQNKSSTRATLTERDPDDVEIPPLPAISTPWHPLTVAWWNAIWPSPMAEEWHDSDIFGLYAVALLYDKFFTAPSEKTHAELRNARMPYGLTPLDRRRLEWTIENASKATRQNRQEENKPVAVAPPTPADDIRLRIV